MSARRIVFVAGPYAAPTVDEIARNVRRAAALGRLAVERGLAPIVPHLLGHAGVYGSPLDDGAAGLVRARALGCSLDLIRRVQPDELWVIRCDDGSESPGVRFELEAWLEATEGRVPRRREAAPWSSWRERLVEAGLLDALEGT